MNAEKQTSGILNKIKISSRITLFNVLLWLLIATVNFAIITYSLRRYLRDNARYELNNRTLNALASVENTELNPSIKSTYFIAIVDAIPIRIITDSGYDLRISTRGGRIFCNVKKDDIRSQSDPKTLYSLNDTESKIIELMPRPAIDENSKADSLEGTSLQYYALELGTNANADMQNSETRYLISFYDSHQDDAIQRQVLELLVFVFFVGAGTLLIFSNILAKTSLEPLTKLSREAMAIDFKKPEKRLGVPESKDEINALTVSLNTMLDNIESSYQRSKRFTQDASHELRIPLTVILGNLEIMEKFSNNPEVSNESFEAIKNEAAGMKQMIERLLTIARMERDNFEPIFSKINILNTIYTLANDSYKSNGRQIEINATDIEVKTDPGLLMQMLRAILDNALKYSSDKIIISTQIHEDFVTIKIKDFGRGIPKSDIENIKNRFYRTDASRNSKTGGIGLGLSIAELIANSLNGNIEIASELGVGTEVSVTLPYLPL